MAGGGGSTEAGEPEFQIAPMLDVLLALLIFFVSITQAQVESVDDRVRVPVAANSKERKPDPNQALVNVIWNEKEQKAILNFNGKDFDDNEELAELLKARAEANPKLEVVIRADRDTPAREVQAAIGVASQATASVSFATVNRD